MKEKRNTRSGTTTLTPALGNGDRANAPAGRAQMEESADARSRQILKAFVAFRDGDFSARLPADWPGIDGRIAETFNQTIVREESISREVRRLSVTVGKEGRLKQRMSLPGAVGDWAVKADSINTLIDDLVRPTVDVARPSAQWPRATSASPWSSRWTDARSGESSCARPSWSTR